MFAEGVLFFKKRIASRLVESVRAYYNKMTELPDSPKKIARGVALGFAFDFLPIPIISIPISYLVARLTRCNPVAAVATVIFFKLAVPFFYTLNILTGKALMGNVTGPDIAISGTSVFANLINLLAGHGYPFLVGSLVNATLAGLAAYFLLMFISERRRRRRSE